jgi:hypothetical protein
MANNKPNKSAAGEIGSLMRKVSTRSSIDSQSPELRAT